MQLQRPKLVMILLRDFVIPICRMHFFKSSQEIKVGKAKAFSLCCRQNTLNALQQLSACQKATAKHLTFCLWLCFGLCFPQVLVLRPFLWLLSTSWDKTKYRCQSLLGLVTPLLLQREVMFIICLSTFFCFSICKIHKYNA